MISQIKLDKSIKLSQIMVTQRPRTCSPNNILKTQASKTQQTVIKNNIPVFFNKSLEKSPTKITNKPKVRLNRSEMYINQFKSPSRLINQSSPIKNTKTKLNDSTKLFKNNNHVPSIFKKNKGQVKLNILIEDQFEQVGEKLEKSNTIKPTNNSNFSKELSTNYQDDEYKDKYRKSTQIQDFIVPNIIINKVKTKSDDDNFLIKMPLLQDFDIGQLLGKGSYGSVRIARHKLTGFFYALKTYSVSKISKNIDRFISSVKLQMYCNHSNIAQVYCMFRQGENMYLVMELCIDGDLSRNIKSLKNKKQQGKDIIKGVVCGLMYLHDEQIIHRDVKLENVLLCYNMPKITDFDLGIYQKNPDEYRKTFCGSPAYFSPEMLSTNVEYNYKVDIWSLGILVHQILCGYYPFDITPDLSNIINCQMKPFSIHIPQVIRSFINIMLVKNPNERATWKQILQHPYFT